MSIDLIHLFTVAGLAILAGVIGFVVGGMIEMKRHRKDILMRRSAIEIHYIEVSKNPAHEQELAA